MEEFEVNGVQYTPKPDKKTGRSPSMMNMAMAMMSVYASAFERNYGEIGRKREPERPDVKLIVEFRLIQEKKSQLSRSQRDWVVGEFKQHFIKVSELPHTQHNL